MQKASIIIGTAGRAVATNLTARRAELAMTQQRLSELLTAQGRPLTRQSITDIETGRRRVDADDLAVLAVVLGVRADLLLDPCGLTQGADRPPGCTAQFPSAARSLQKVDSQVDSQVHAVPTGRG